MFFFLHPLQIQLLFPLYLPLDQVDVQEIAHLAVGHLRRSLQICHRGRIVSVDVDEMRTFFCLGPAFFLTIWEQLVLVVFGLDLVVYPVRISYPVHEIIMYPARFFDHFEVCHFRFSHNRG